MAKFSKKMMGKEIGSASTYAAPHDMNGKPTKMSTNPGSGPNNSKLDTLNPSVGNRSKDAGNQPVKTSGIKMRGTGAATKGLMSRGPMA